MTELAAPQISSLMEALPGIAAVLRSPVASAMVSLVRSGVGLEDFKIGDAEELLKFGIRRNLITQEEVDRLLEEVRETADRRPVKPAVPAKVEKPAKAVVVPPAPAEPVQVAPKAATPAPKAKAAQEPVKAPAAAKMPARTPPKPAAKAVHKPAPKPVAKAVKTAPAKAPAKPPVKAKAPVKAPAKPASKPAAKPAPRGKTVAKKKR